MQQNAITLNDKGQPTSYVGPEAVNFFAVRVLRSAMTSKLTGKQYKRTALKDAYADICAILDSGKLLENVEIVK